MASATASVLVQRGSRVVCWLAPRFDSTPYQMLWRMKTTVVTGGRISRRFHRSVRSQGDLAKPSGIVDALLNIAATFSADYSKTKEGSR